MALGAMLAVTALAGSPAGAHAGSYDVYACTDPVTGRSLGSFTGWRLLDSHPGESNYNLRSTCAADGGSLSLTPTRTTNGASIAGSDDSPRYGELLFEPPAGVRLRAYEVWRAMHVHGTYPFIVTRQHDGSNPEFCHASFRPCEIGDLGAPLAGANRASFTAEGAGATYMGLMLMCVGSCPKTDTAATVRLFSARMTLEEHDRPTFSHPPSGTLLEAGEVSGTRTLDLVAADVGSGVRKVTITSSAAGGTVLASKVLDAGNGRCQAEKFTYTVPCPLAIDDTVDVDTKRFPDGPQTIFIEIQDAAGNTRAVSKSITVRNAPTMTTAPSIGGFTGRIAAGDTLACDPGVFDPQPDAIAYAWLVDGTPVAGQANPTYVVRTQDVGRPIVCRVTASRGGGSTTAESAPVGGSGQPGGAPPAASGGTGGTGGTGTTTGSTGPGGGGSTTTSTTNATTTSTTSSSTVVVGPPTNGANASNSARIAITGKRKRKLAFGRTLRTSVTLRDEHGRPISGARVAVLERMRVPGAAWVPAREPVTTDADGRVALTLPAGHSRTVRFAYKANLGNTEFQSVTDVVLVVRSKTTFKRSKAFLRNGQTVRFSGRLLSRPVPVGGVLIDLQAKVGKRWQTFITTRTKRSGKWGASYRFRATRGLQTYRFRARVRQDTGYPYALSRSRSVKVKVQG